MVHVFVKKLVDEWAKMGHHCVVISPLSLVHTVIGKEPVCPKLEKQEVGDGLYVDVYRPRYLSIPKMLVGGVSLNNYVQQCCIEGTIKSTGIKFDVIYCHFYAMAVEGWHYSHKNNIPLFVATGESSFTRLQPPSKSFTFNALKETLYGVVSVSSKNKKEAIDMGYANEKDTEVFPNAANLHIFCKKDKVECRKELGLPEDKFIILCVGQLTERKGQKRILKALNLLDNDNIKTIFVGKGEDVLEHKSILYCGIAQNTQLPIYLNAADVFVLPTQKEGCCNAIIEALACGCPIISSDRSFNWDVLNKQNSIMVDPDNIQQIADAINKVYADKKLKDQLAESAFAMGKSLGIETRAQNILNFMKRKIAERSKK